VAETRFSVNFCFSYDIEIDVIDLSVCKFVVVSFMAKKAYHL
jgi:hypothetical protein